MARRENKGASSKLLNRVRRRMNEYFRFSNIAVFACINRSETALRYCQKPSDGGQCSKLEKPKTKVQYVPQEPEILNNRCSSPSLMISRLWASYLSIHKILSLFDSFCLKFLFRSHFAVSKPACHFVCYHPVQITCKCWQFDALSASLY